MGVSIGSGSSSTNGYSITAPPKYVSNAYKGIISQAQDTAATPYTPYTGQLTAGLTDTQNQATSNLASAQNAYQPYYDQASQYGQQATTAVTPMEFNEQTISQYQNPYTQSVVNATMADLAKLFGQQQTQVTGNAISSGAWGGDRAGIVKSNLANNQSQTAASTLANLYSNAYNNAVSQFNTANNAQMGAQQQNNANALSAANLYQNLGTGASTNAINLGQALMGAGKEEQATNQAGLDAQYQQFLNQQQYPFETLSWLTGIATGVGSNAGGTSIGSSTTNSSGMSGNLKFEDGGRVEDFASGGAAMPYGAKKTQAGLALPIQAAAQGSGPPRAQIPQGEAKIPAAPSGNEQGTQQPSNLQQAIQGIKDSYAPIPGTPAQVSMGVAENPVAGLSGIIPGSGAAGIGSILPMMADGGAVDDEGVPLIFGPDPIQNDGAISAAPGVDALPGRPMAGLGAPEGLAAPGVVSIGAPAQQAGLGASPTVPQAGLGRSQPRTLRTNNPGAIEDGPFARSQPGYVGSDGRYAVFESPQAGLGAMNKLLDVYQSKHGINTVAGTVGRWAPSAVDNNDTSGYVNYVAKRLGVDPNAPLSPEQRAGLAPAMAYYEAGREFPTSGNPLAATDANGRVQMAGSAPQAGLGYAKNEDMLPANAQPVKGKIPPPIAGLQPPPQGGQVDDGKAFGAAMQAGLYGLLTTGSLGTAIQAGTQTYNDMQYRLRGQLSPNEKMQLLQQQMIQSQADKLAADVEKAKAERTQVVTNPNTGRSYLVDRVTGAKQLLDEGQTADLEIVKDVAGNSIGSFNKRTGQFMPLPAGAAPQLPGLPAGVKPTPDYDNWRIAQAGGDPRSFAQYQADLKKQGAQSVTIAGEGAESKALGEARGKAASEVEAGARNATENLSKLNLLGALLERAKTGALAPTESTVVGWTQALGIDPAKLGLNPNQAISDQAISKITNELTVGMIGPGGFPANNFSDADRKFISDIFPKISNRPEANAINLEVLRRLQTRKMEVADAWGDYQEAARADGKTPSFGDFERQFRKEHKGEDLFGDIRAMVDNLAPAKGASPSGAPAAPPPAPNARQAPDGNWYVPNPGKPGSWMKVVQ